MKEHPIIFSSEMIRAILEGRKTQTRRIVKFKKPFQTHSAWEAVYPHPSGIGFIFTDKPLAGDIKSSINRMASGHGGKLPPYGWVGDRLWVRESIWIPKHPSPKEIKNGADTWFKDKDCTIPIPAYVADGNCWQEKEWGWKFRSARFMPRWASRIMLEIENIRVERVQEITEEDAKSEGIQLYNIHDFSGYAHSGNCKTFYGYAKEAFKSIWDFLNGKRGFGWDTNPWVWVIEFKKL